MAYLYRHVRLDKNQPFYVGIGVRENYRRAKTIVRRNKFWKNVVNKTAWEFEIILDDLTWEQALEKEKEFISIYGRSDLNKGTLTNLTDGGDGTLGMIVSDEFRKRLSVVNTGKKLTAEHSRKISLANKGRTFSKETKIKMSETAKGRKASPGTRAKMSAMRMGNKSNTGRKLPQSQRDKMKESQRARRDREKNLKIINGKVL